MMLGRNCCLVSWVWINVSTLRLYNLRKYNAWLIRRAFHRLFSWQTISKEGWIVWIRDLNGLRKQLIDFRFGPFFIKIIESMDDALLLLNDWLASQLNYAIIMHNSVIRFINCFFRWLTYLLYVHTFFVVVKFELRKISLSNNSSNRFFSCHNNPLDHLILSTFSCFHSKLTTFHLQFEGLPYSFILSNQSVVLVVKSILEVAIYQLLRLFLLLNDLLKLFLFL